MKIGIRLFAASILICSCVSSCSDYDPTEDINYPLDTYFGEGKNFDFSTSCPVTFDVDYGTGIGAKAYVEIYDKIPEEGVEATPLYSTVTDEQGRINSNITLPSYLKSVCLVNHRFGMPEYVECKIENGKVTWRNPSIDKAPRMATRSVDNTNYSDCVKLIDKSKNLYTITSWTDQFGNVQNHPLVHKDTELAGDDYTTYVNNLQYTLWGSTTTKTRDNSIYALGAEKINTKILDKYINDEGREIDVESVSLSLVFMNEGAWYQNTLGYYYYKTDIGLPENKYDLKTFICLPNASKPNHYPYGGSSAAYHPDNANDGPAYAGESIDLLFEKEDGTFTKNFPPGYTVGYFVISDGFQTKDRTVGSIDAGKPYFYSNEVWNSSGTKRFMALSLPNGAIVYGLEDNTDNSYEDNLFIIKGTPNEAIHNPDIPTIDTEEKTIYYWDTQDQTYAYEDIWPNGGDYDLNDVVIEHTRNVEFDNNKNLRTVEDIFTLNEKQADYNDGFAIQLNKTYLNGLTIKKDGTDITSSVHHFTDSKNNDAETYILFEDLQEIEKGTTITVTRKFTGSTTKDVFEGAEKNVNPFVISRFTEADYNAGKMVEIHIPNFGNRTSKSTNALSTGSDYFYVSRKDGNTYPFAICLPVKSFHPSPEGVSIDKTYLQFNNWVNNNGTEDKDWYLK